MPIDMRTIKFDFNHDDYENVCPSLEFRMRKEVVDNLETILQEKGFDAFLEAIPTSIVGAIDWENMTIFHITPEIHQIRTPEEVLEYMREEIPDYELSK